MLSRKAQKNRPEPVAQRRYEKREEGDFRAFLRGGNVAAKRLVQKRHDDQAQRQVDDHEAAVVNGGIDVGIGEGSVEQRCRLVDAVDRHAADEVDEEAAD